MNIHFTFFPLVQGQTAYDVADTEIFRLLEELKKKQATAQKDRGDINSILQKKGASTPKRRSVFILPKRHCKLKMPVYFIKSNTVVGCTSVWQFTHYCLTEYCSAFIDLF